MSAESAQMMPERSELVTAEHRLNELGITLRNLASLYQRRRSRSVPTRKPSRPTTCFF